MEFEELKKTMNPVPSRQLFNKSFFAFSQSIFGVCGTNFWEETCCGI